MKLKNNKIKAILFDMVGVLLFKKRNYFPKSKRQLNAERIEKLYNHIDDKKLLFNIKEKLGLTAKEIKEALFYIPKKYKKFEKLWDSLPRIKKKYKLAVINNGNAIADRYWREEFNFGIFDALVNSAKEGIRKPDPKIYLLVCKKLKVKPENCLFMDDLSENIKTANKLKMKTILWDNRNKAYKKLVSLVDSV